MEMARPIKNYHRFYASFNKLQKHGSDEDTKAALVSQYTGGRTTHLSEMRVREYNDCCKALENMLGYGDQRKRHRSICLHLMQELDIDTKDWQRINDFCSHPRICGKVFALLDIPELEALELKLRAIKRKGGLRGSEERRASASEERRAKSEDSSGARAASSSSPNINPSIIIIQQNGNNDSYNPTTAGSRPAGSRPC